MTLRLLLITTLLCISTTALADTGIPGDTGGAGGGEDTGSIEDTGGGGDTGSTGGGGDTGSDDGGGSSVDFTFTPPDEIGGYGTSGAPSLELETSGGCGRGAFVLLAPLFLLGARRRQ